MSMRIYEAGFGNQRHTIQAETLYSAKKQALEHFKPTKRQAGLVWVVLADKPLNTRDL